MDRLKTLRKEKGVTQKEVGEYLGISYQAYSHYENGLRNPDNETLKKLATYFGVSVDYLLGREEKMPAGFPTDISELEADLRKVNFPVDEWMQLTDEQKHILLSTIENFIKSNK